MKKVTRWHYANLASVITGVIAIVLFAIEFGVGFLVIGQPLFEAKLFWISSILILIISWAYSYFRWSSLAKSDHDVTLTTEMNAVPQGIFSRIGAVPVFNDQNTARKQIRELTEEVKELKQDLDKKSNS